tara:strand:- start:989 stop:2245 length:1257 start_codon:yes stop_codon:yes gene_type:complete
MTTQTIDTPMGSIPSPSQWNAPMQEWLEERSDVPIMPLEKATDGRTTLTDIAPALEEYKRLFKAGIASSAETLTLHRAYPDSSIYQKAVVRKGLVDAEPMVVGGPASVELVDREGHLITTNAMRKAFDKYMANFRTRNAMVLHSDVQVGWALPAYISKAGQIFKSGVDDKGLFFITELRDDTNIASKVMEQVNEGKLKSYSIAGSATKTQMIQKGMQEVMQVDDMELAEVTVCEKGVNQAAAFDILKADDAVSTCIDGSCLLSKEETKLEGAHLMTNDNGFVDFTQSFLAFAKEEGYLSKGREDWSGEFPTLYNTQGRQTEHHSLLNRLGFPAELEPEYARNTPVVEGYGPFCPSNPRVVNEAGQNLGHYSYEDSLTPPQIGPWTKPGVVEGGNSTEVSVTKSFLNWADGDVDVKFTK